MAILKRPTDIKVYFKTLQQETGEKRDKAVKEKEVLVEKLNDLHKIVSDYIPTYKEKYSIDINNYKEFKENRYSIGTFHKLAKGLLTNSVEQYKLTDENYALYNLASSQLELRNKEKEINLYNKILGLTLKEYRKIVKTFYTEVHKKLVLEGAGYVFENPLGWTCINRIRVHKSVMIDYQATKKREAELKAKGIKIYNKEEAEWCKSRGLEYKAADKRVFKHDEHCYEIPLIGCKLENGRKYKLEISDYRGPKIRGHSNEDLLREYNKDCNALCELDVDLRTKLKLALESNKMLYSKFIRNENQTSIKIRETNR